MKDIIFNPLLKLSNVNRYSGVFLLKPESVSDHTCQVGLMAIVVANELNKKIKNCVNLEKLALKCLVHDIDESSLTYVDIPRNVKYANPKITHEFKKLETESVQGTADQLQFPVLYDLWKKSKDSTIEGRIVKLCDMLTVIRKVDEEVTMLSNKYMLRVAVEVFQQVKEEKEKLIKIMVDNTEDIVLQFFLSHYNSAFDILSKILERNKEIAEYYYNSKV